MGRVLMKDVLGKVHNMKGIPAVRHTSCRHCGQDIEGIYPYRKGEWRDRGNNPTCPNEAGDKGQAHAPYIERRK